MKKTRLRIGIISSIIALFIIGCSRNQKNLNIEKFDLVKFKKNKVDIKNKYRYTVSDSVVTLLEEPKFYVKEKRAMNDSMVVCRKVYNKENLNLHWSGKIIFNAAGPILIGVAKNYDLEGNIVKEIDFDRGMSYPMVDLIKKVKTDFNLVIDTNKDTYYIIRDYKDKLYYVCFKKINEYGFEKPYWLVFDGLTGDFIKEEIVPLKD